MKEGISKAKSALRLAMRARVATLSFEERTERSRHLVRRLVELPAWREASRVLLFASLPAEPDLDLLWQEGALAGKEVAYPRVEGIAIRLYDVGSPDELEPTRWGLREPPPRTDREAALENFGLALVPGLAFGAGGERLGRGGGFYDRLLAGRTAKTRLVGVGFAFQRIDWTMPLAAHDVKVDEVCTD